MADQESEILAKANEKLTKIKVRKKSLLRSFKIIGYINLLCLILVIVLALIVLLRLGVNGLKYLGRDESVFYIALMVISFINVVAIIVYMVGLKKKSKLLIVIYSWTNSAYVVIHLITSTVLFLQSQSTNNEKERKNILTLFLVMSVYVTMDSILIIIVNSLLKQLTGYNRSFSKTLSISQSLTNKSQTQSAVTIEQTDSVATPDRPSRSEGGKSLV